MVELAAALRQTGYAFVTPTPATHALVNARPGAEWARSSTDVFGWSRPFRARLVPVVVAEPIMALMREAGVLLPAGEGFRSAVRVSSLGGQLFFHSAYPTGAADAVFFGPDTYRFCAAIATLPEGRVRRAADVGCGAGPGAVMVALRYPAAEVVGVDINPEALRLTRVNAELAGARVQAVQSDLLSAVEGAFDLIVANPPYLVDPAARAYRHGGGPLGAGLSLAILDAALDRLAAGGTLLLYTGAAIVNGDDLFKRAAAARLAGSDVRWSYREADPDVFGEELAGGVYTETDRIAAVVLTVTNVSKGESDA